MVHKANLSSRELKAIKSRYGHHNGGIKLYDIRTKKKVHIKEPEYLQHYHTIIGRGFHPKHGHRIAQIVKTT